MMVTIMGEEEAAGTVNVLRAYYENEQMQKEFKYLRSSDKFTSFLQNVSSVFAV